MIIRVLYTVFLSLLVAFFVGMGISAFYVAPKAPEMPIELQYPETNKTYSAEDRAKQSDFDNKQKQYQKDFSQYNQIVSAIAIAFAVVIMIISLTMLGKILIISDGLLLGGVWTLGYGMIRGFMTESSIYRFLVVSVGLLIALILGYIKFVKNPKK